MQNINIFGICCHILLFMTYIVDKLLLYPVKYLYWTMWNTYRILLSDPDRAPDLRVPLPNWSHCWRCPLCHWTLPAYQLAATSSNSCSVFDKVQ